MANFDNATYGTTAEMFGATPFKEQTSLRLAPEGRHQARLVDYQELSNIKREFQGQVRVQDEVHLLFEILGQTSRTFACTFGMKLSWRQNAKLYQFFEETFGTNGFPAGFDTNWIQNLPCEVKVVHKGSQNLYAVVTDMIPAMPSKRIMSGEWRNHPDSRIDPALDSPTSPWANGEIPPEKSEPSPPSNPAAMEIAKILFTIKDPARLEQLAGLRDMMGNDSEFLVMLREEQAAPVEIPVEPKKRGRPKGSKNKAAPVEIPVEPTDAPEPASIPEDEI